VRVAGIRLPVVRSDVSTIPLTGSAGTILALAAPIRYAAAGCCSRAVAGATRTAGPQTGVVTSSPSTGPAARGIVRLLNTAGGRALCLAGEVDGPVVASFLRRYGREPVRIDRIDAGSVISLSGPGLELLLDHLDAAERAGRPVAVDPAPQVERLLAGARACPDGR
jgi:hypothetical protein